MTNVEALKALYHALGGDLDDVADVSTIVGVLNAISAKFDGADDAELNAQGIANITEIIGNITADLTTLDVTPTTEAQNIKPTAPIDGYNEVNVSAVTAAIDSNITAGNIKKDVQILGVTGSYEGSGGETFEVDMSISQESESSLTATYSSNKTFTEVMSAADNGDIVQVNLTYTVGGSAVTADVLLSGKSTLSGLDVFVMLIVFSDMSNAIAVWAGNSENIIVSTATIPSFTIGWDG